MEENTEHFYFNHDTVNNESINLSFDVKDDTTIYKFHRMCKKFAAVCGYSNGLIEKVFGESIYEEDENVL